MARPPTLASSALALLLTACDQGSTPPTDGGAASPDRPPGTDVPADAPPVVDDRPTPPVDVFTPPPFDAGAPPPCTRSAVYRRVASRGEGVRDLSVGGLAPYRGGFVVAVHESAPRATADASLTRRDTVGTLAIDHDAQVQRPLELVYASTAMRSDLAVPALIPLAEGALMTFGETRGVPGAVDSIFQLRGSRLDPGAVPGVPAVLLESHGDGTIAPLPDGRALLLSSRLRSVGDGGVLVVSPTTYRVDREGRIHQGQDVTSYVRLDSESLLLRPAPDGAVLYSRLGDDLLQLRFDRDGSVDLRGAIRTPRFGALRLDDAACLGDVSVLAWGAAMGGEAVVNAAVVRRDGTLVATRELDRFVGEDPIVAVAPAFGGAAVAWLRGAGATTTIRATTVQPDGLVRNSPRDVTQAPHAGGRLWMVVGEGARVATFAAQTGDGHGAQGVGVGRSCLP